MSEALILNDNRACQSKENLIIKVQPLSFQITRCRGEGRQLKGESKPSPLEQKTIGPSMVTDGPRGTAESFILVQQIHSRGL